MGKLMGFVKKDYPGEVDMGLVGKIQNLNLVLMAFNKIDLDNIKAKILISEELNEN